MDYTLPLSDALAKALLDYVTQYNAYRGQGDSTPLISPEDALLSFVLPHLLRVQQQKEEAKIAEAVQKFRILDTKTQDEVLAKLDVSR